MWLWATLNDLSSYLQKIPLSKRHETCWLFSHFLYLHRKEKCYLSLYVSVTQKVTLRMFGRPCINECEGDKSTLFSEHKYTKMKWQHYNTSTMRNTQTHNCKKWYFSTKKYSKLWKVVIFIVIMILHKMLLFYSE